MLSFTIVNYYQILTNGIENRLFVVIGYAIQINFMFWVGLFLNYPQISFFPLNFILTNLSLFAGGIIWVFLSVGFQNNFSLLGTPSFLILTREVKSFWSSDLGDYINGPSVDMFAFVGVSLIGLIVLFLFHVKKYFYSKNILSSWKSYVEFLKTSVSLILLFCLFYFSVYSSLALLGRTSIIVFFSCLLLTSFFLLKITTKAKNLRVVYSRIFIFLFALLLILFAIVFLLDLQSLVVVSNRLFEAGIATRLREEGLETARYEFWRIAIREMLNYPWGGRLIKLDYGVYHGQYVHNIWLDQLRDAGLISMLLLLFFHLAQIYFWAKIRLLNITNYYKVFFLCTLIAFLAAFVQAPVLQANPTFFAMTCFTSGSLIRLICEAKKNVYKI